ncbi:MAG: serine hydrolase [Candidatus Eremiobacteraeota bacterium]|nr:serine hydrolase [Candidatus Eremiobacteraeota bacterium]
MQRGDVLAESYGTGFAKDQAHALYSGTKSFWGPTALLVETDGILKLDEAVSETITEWRGDPQKERITIRMLLSLTAGYGFGGLGRAVPTFERAIALPLKDPAGTTFTYGGIPLQVFGAVLARKLTAQRLTPHEYLRERLLQPAGVEVDSWRTLKDGNQTLPTGAFITARNWIAYGHHILAWRASLAACFQGSAQNPRYGLGWWLGVKNAPDDLVYASGSGGQALYLIPSHELAIVHFGKRSSYKHEAFMRQLFRGG